MVTLSRNEVATNDSEKRREAQIEALEAIDESHDLEHATIKALNALLAHFEESGQQALADAVRYGLVEDAFNLCFSIDYPEPESLRAADELMMSDSEGLTHREGEKQ